MKFISIIFFLAVSMSSDAQDSAKATIPQNNITVSKDPRLNILEKKETDFNVANGVLYGGKLARGYRLMLLNTNNQALAMKVRTQLLQNFPEQKVYMTFQPPYIKVKFGDFLEKDDADRYKSEIAGDKIVTTNIYIVSDMVEIKPDKSKDNITPTSN